MKSRCQVGNEEPDADDERRRRRVDADGLARERLDGDLHAVAEAQHQVKGRVDGADACIRR